MRPSTLGIVYSKKIQSLPSPANCPSDDFSVAISETHALRVFAVASYCSFEKIEPRISSSEAQRNLLRSRIKRKRLF